MNKEIVEIEKKLSQTLEQYVSRMSAIHPEIIAKIGDASNKYMPLRIYAAFRKSALSDELALMVDANISADQIALSADFCWENGELLYTGPSSTIARVPLRTDEGSDFDTWLRSFLAFLEHTETAVAAAIAESDVRTDDKTD